MHLIPLDTADDPRLEPYTHTRDGAALRRGGHFIAEGRTVVELLLSQSLYAPHSLLIAASRAASLSALVERALKHVPVYSLPDVAIEALVGFPFHRGVLAAGHTGPAREPADLIASHPRLVLALEGVNNHDNIGAAFRNGAAFGAGAVLLDPRTADPLYRKSIRVSMGHALRIPFARAASSRQLNEMLSCEGYHTLALTPGPDALPLREACAPGRLGPRVCVLVGAEGPGLSVAAQRSATTRVTIPMAPEIDSLNLAAAAAIALSAVYESFSAP